MLRSSRSLLAMVVMNAVLALGASGCAGVNADLGSSRNVHWRPVIGYVVTNTTHHLARELGGGFRAGARGVGGVEATVVGPRATNPVRQVELFKELTRTAGGGIAVSASSPGLIARPLAEAAGRGIPLAVSSGKPPPGSRVTLLIENDNYALGRMLAIEAIKRLPPRATGKVVLGTEIPGHPALEQRARGMRDQFTSALPTVRVVGPVDTMRDQSSNRAAWRLLVAANPDALAFLGTGDTDAFNLADVRAGTRGRWLAGGFSLEPHVLHGVKNGDLFAVVSPEHFLQGAATGWLLAQHAKHNRPLPQGWLVTPGLAITEANVDEIIQRQSSEIHKLAWAKPQLDEITSQPDEYIQPLDNAR